MPKLLFSLQIAATVVLFTAYLYIIIAVWW